VRVCDAYPLGAVGGACLVTKEYRVKPGEKVVDLGIDIENLPTHGLLCISQKGVQLMATALGWKVSTREESKSVLAEQAAQIKSLEAQNAKLNDALRAVLSAADLVEVDTAAIREAVSA
jgi:hypothetical protein